MIAISALGLGEIVGSSFSGKMADIIGSALTMWVNLILHLVTIASMLWFILIFKYNTVSACIMCFLWGLCEATIGVFVTTQMGFEFDSKTLPFAVYNLVKSVFVFSTLFVLSVLESQQSFIYYTVGVGVFGAFGWLIMIAKFRFRGKKEESKLLSGNTI